MTVLRLLLPAVFASGAAALAEEVIWSRALRRILGSTSLAQGAVLAAILGGMALGSWLLRGPGSGSPEACVRRGARGWSLATSAAGASALLFQGLLALVESFDSPPGGTASLLLAALAAAAAPVGAAFPLSLGALGAAATPRVVGALYGLGALGGAAGAMAVPLLLLPRLGERASLGLAVLIQLAAAGWVGRALGRLGALPAAASGGAPGSPGCPLPFARVRARTLDAWVVFLSGLAVVYWEVTWSRLLFLVVGSSVHAFAVVTGGVVLGIGVGSVLGGGSARPADAAIPLAVLGVLAGGYFAVPYLPDAYLLAARAFGTSPWWGALGAGLVVLAACAPLGLIFPGVVGRDPEGAGRLAAANGVGAALGGLAGGPFLAERVGIEASYLLGLLLVAGVAVSCAARGAAPARRIGAAASVAVLIALLLAAGRSVTSGWDFKRLLAGVYQWPAEDLREREPAPPDRALLVVVGGREAIVSVEREAGTVFIKANGKVEGSVPAEPGQPSLADLPTQLLLGALPALLGRGEKVAVVGLGSGTTLGAAHRSGCRSIDILELEPAFERALLAPACAPLFAPYLAGALSSPRVRRWYGDARLLLAPERRLWDAIVSQPSEPWTPASAHLFTREFFARAARRLSPAGAFVQWIQLYKLSGFALQVLVRTFRGSFERVFILRPPGTGEVILIGLRDPVDFEVLLAAAARMLDREPSLLLAAGIEEPADLLAAFILGPDGVEEWLDGTGGGELNTDDLGRVEFLAPALFHRGADLARANLRALRERSGRDPLSRYLPPSLRSRERLRELAARNLRLGDLWEAIALLEGDPSGEAEGLRAEARREIAALALPTGEGTGR